MKKTTIYRQQKDTPLFEKELTNDTFSVMGNPLEQLSSLVDFEMFRPVLKDVPDEKTVWNVNNQWSQAGTFDALSNAFRELLNSKGFSFNKGKIIDASFAAVPKQRNTHENKKFINF